MREIEGSIACGGRFSAPASGLLTLLLLASLGAGADQGPLNPNLEDGTLGEVPAGWFLPGPSRQAGYRAQLSEDRPQEGKRCVLLSREAADRAAGFGNLMQSFDATPYRGRRIRLLAAVRTEVAGAGNRAQLWVRVDRKGGQVGFFDNMGDRPIADATWRDYEIVGDVAEDAEGIALGLLLIGNGRAWLDAVRLEIVGKVGEGNEPARPLEERGLDNLIAFGRLLGYVRYFHPSDQAAATDWDRFAIDGVRAVEAAKDPAALARILERVFRPIAPSVRIFPTGKPPTAAIADVVKPPQEKGAGPLKVLAWRHFGVGLGRSPIYSSQRIDLQLPRPLFEQAPPGAVRPDPAKPYVADLGGGVSCLVPVALYAIEKGTFSRPGSATQVPDDDKADLLLVARPGGFRPSGNDRATRLAAVILAWNVFQHFYPYFDVVDADWPGELRRALTRAATDADECAFLQTLRRLIAALHDGHGNVYGAGMPDSSSFPPFGWDWVEDQLVVTGVAASGAGGLKPGDVVVEIDGKPAAKVLAEHEATISGATPQWRRYQALAAAAAGPRDSGMTLEVRATAAGSDTKTQTRRQTIRVRRTLDPVAFLALRQLRPAKIAAIKPGVIYLDLSRITQQEFDEAVPRMAEARGIVFDLRGYPQKIAVQTIGHLIDKPVTCAQWHIPVTFFPDRRDVAFSFSNWPVEPKAPRFQAKVAFLTDGRAISYAETYLAIIEHYKLADIVGGPTAGTNGNVNPFTLPGGYQVAWTGMKVLKHDGSRHHGVGVQPTVPAARTIRGVTEGRDEVLDRAVAVVSP